MLACEATTDVLYLQQCKHQPCLLLHSLAQISSPSTNISAQATHVVAGPPHTRTSLCGEIDEEFQDSRTNGSEFPWRQQMSELTVKKKSVLNDLKQELNVLL